MTDERLLRIGEFSRRTGVSVELLRAWERRYGVPNPERTEQGLRLYGESDRVAVERMRAQIAAGLSAAEAARVARATAEGGHAPEDGDLDASARRMRAALDGYREGAAQAELDLLLGRYRLETVLQRVILPFLRDLGERWACGEATVGQEHFASAILHGRLVSLARGWDAGVGPAAVVAAAPGELHTLGLLCFALMLRAQGWRITYLGADTPLDSLGAAVESVTPDAVVVASVDGARLHLSAPDLRPLATRALLAVGGAGAGPTVAEASAATLLDEDPGRAAEQLAAVVGARAANR